MNDFVSTANELDLEWEKKKKTPKQYTHKIN